LDKIQNGRVRVHAAEHIILEGSVEGEPLDWALPESVSVEFADGTVCELRVDVARSTLGGSLLPGQTLRLYLFSSGASVQRGSVRRVTLGSLAIAVIAD
jgi:hypothetical protein